MTPESEAGDEAQAGPTANQAHSWPVFASARPITGFPRFRHPASGVGAGTQSTVGSGLDAVADQNREPSAAEQQALRQATEQGYADGLESGKRAASEAQVQLLAELQSQCALAQEQLRVWSAELEQAFVERCVRALEAIVGERLRVQDDFFAELLKQAARELHSDIDSLQLEVSSDLEGALKDDIVAVVNAELNAGEIRISNGARVAQLPLAELVAEMLADLPTVAEVDLSTRSKPESDDAD